ncbi:MAG: molybdopterin-dependent oxidoreductase, partial [Dehalococcoidia bacterium]
GVLLPLAGHAPFDGSAGVALSLALSSTAFLVALLALWRPVAAPGAPPAARLRERREVIAGIGLVVLGMAMARQVIGRLPSLPVLTGHLPSPITPAGDFYVVSKNLVDPTVALDGWRLAVDGLVERPLALTYQEITALPSEEFVRTLECISNEIGGDLISTGQFTGVPLAAVLRMAGVRPGAAVLHFTSVDGYTENMPIAKAMDPATFLVYRLDGEPLPPKHGFPLRVLGAGTYGMKNPKWLQRIEVVTEAAEGYWTQQGWTPDAVVQTMSRIDVPGPGALASGDIPLAGIAYSGDRGIRQVEVSTDGGSTWQAAALDPPLGPLTWVFWRLLARLDPGPGSIEVRATDGTGAVQTEIERDTFPDGATGHHHVEVRVTG